MAPEERIQLVVIGSGWVGLYIAQYIETKVFSVSNISPDRTRTYTPLLASAACGRFPFSCAEEFIRAKGRHLRFLEANAVGIDFTRQQVRCVAAVQDDRQETERHFAVSYQKLVISPGCTLTRAFGLFH